MTASDHTSHLSLATRGYRRRFAALACLVTLLAATVAASAQGSARKPLDPPVVVKTGSVTALSDAGIFVARDLGYFKDEGLDVQIVPIQAGPEIIPFLATGQIQVSGLAVSPALFNALDRGVKLKIVADKGQVNANSHWAAVVVRSDLAGQVKDWSDLKGRKIAVPAKGVTSWTELVYGLSLAHLTPSDVDIVELSFPNMIAALANKGIDAATLIEPFVTIATGKGAAVRFEEVQTYYPYKAENGVIVYSEQFMREQPQAAKRWMIAYLRGIRTYLKAMADGTNRDKIIDILASDTGVKDKALYAKLSPIGFDPDGKLDAGSIESDQKWENTYGLVPKLVDVSKAIDLSYAADAAKTLDAK